MTQLHRARSGHLLRTWRRHHRAAGSRQCRRHPDHGIVDGGEPSGRLSVGHGGAREDGAKIIHVDPRFTRTSAMADIWVPLRAGTRHPLPRRADQLRHRQQQYFHDYVLHYTNASVPLRDDFKDTEDLDGVFSGWDPEQKKYEPDSWMYQDEPHRDAVQSPPELPTAPAATASAAAKPATRIIQIRPDAPSIRAAYFSC